LGRSIALIVCLAAAFALAWANERTPQPAPASAPATAFSAARAMADVEAIAKTPHPIGSPANAAVRDHLLRRMSALGLSPQVQRTQVLRQRGDAAFGGVVENLVGVLPGRDRASPAVLVMAHYDSVPGSPGAADDAAGAAAALEIVRALKAQGTPARDVIVLLTDGEESGLLGAQAFFDQHPLARRAGFVLNMEARGGSGRAQMFQTGPDNAGTIALLRRGSVSPAASSLTVFMYEQMPNDTDFSVPRARQISGLNYAFIGGQFDYHSPTSTPANLDKGSLQHLGQETLAATREAAFAPALPAKAQSLVYANTFGGHILAYPQPLGWAVLALAAILFVVGVVQARSRGALPWPDVLKGAGAALYAASLAMVAFRLARRATGAGFGYFEQRDLLAQSVRWEVALALLAIGTLAMAAAAAGRGRSRIGAAALVLGLGAACSIFGALDVTALAVGGFGAALALLSFGRPTTLSGAWAGVLLTGFVVALALQVLAPPTAFLAAWPLTLATLAAALTGLASRRNLPQLAILALAGALGLAWLLAFAHGVYLGLDLPELLAVFVWLAALLLWPLTQPGEDRKGARLAAMAMVFLGVVAVGVVRFDPPWTARHPQATHIAYYVDTAKGLSWRFSDMPRLPAWTRDVLTSNGGKVQKLALPFLWREEAWAAPAQAVAATAPTAELTKDADGTQRLTVLPTPGARTLAMNVKTSAALTKVALNGAPVKLLGKAGDSAKFYWEVPENGLTLTFRSATPGTLDVSYSAVLDQWPADAAPLPPRPADLMAFGTSGATYVGGARKFSW
jgi:Peptidase family M28